MFLCVLSGLEMELSAWKITQTYKTPGEQTLPPGENCVKIVGWSIATSWPSTMGFSHFATLMVVS